MRVQTKISQLSKLARLPIYFLLYKTTRKTSRLHPYPLNITVSVNNYCDSACRTCNIWRFQRKEEEKDELTLAQWKDIFRQLNGTPAWMTFTGGNQFLREDFADICEHAIRYCQPLAMTIPVSGTLPEKVARDVRKIAASCKQYGTKLIINLSLDGVGESHDNVRGKKGSFSSTLNTYHKLRSIEEEFPGVLTLGVYSVVSTLNINSMLQTISFVKHELGCNEHNIEIAGLRTELDNTNSDIVPDAASYNRIAQQHKDSRQGKHRSRISLLRTALRSRHTTKVLPCFASIASVYISAAGEVRACPVKDFVLGDLKKERFRDIWNSEEAANYRKHIKQSKCKCTLANAYTANILLNPSHMLKRRNR